MEPVVKRAVIIEGPHSIMMAEMSNGEFIDLFAWYIDELSFDASEVIGLTARQATDLHHERDLAYLRS